MELGNTEILLTILAITAGTMITRFLPFVLFPQHKETPKLVQSLGKLLPPAMMGLLVIYCLKDVNLTQYAFGLPQGLSILAIILIHRWKNNVLLSIGAGTVLYMVLVQVIF